MGQYVIVYRIENEDVVILHVFHGSRDIEAFFHHFNDRDSRLLDSGGAVRCPHDPRRQYALAYTAP